MCRSSSSVCYGEVALGDDVFGQEASEPGAEGAGITHDFLH